MQPSELSWSVLAFYGGSPDILIKIALDVLSQQEPTMRCNVVSCRVMHLLVVTAAQTRKSSSWPSMMSCHLLGPRNLASHRKELEGWHHGRAGAWCLGEHWGICEGSVPAYEDEQTCFILCELGVCYPWHVCLNELWGVIKCETCKSTVSQTVCVLCEQIFPSPTSESCAFI